MNKLNQKYNSIIKQFEDINESFNYNKLQKMTNINFGLSIEGIVNDMKNINFMQPIYESITNSLEANATKIEVEFFANEENIEDCIINSFKIKDNGDGFNEENIKSFNTYRSDYKKNDGCKGVGRFTWLKVYKNVHIESIVKNKKIEIFFSLDSKNNTFNEENIENVASNNTIITFNNLNEYYLKRRERINLEDIKKNIKENLFIKLFLLKEKNKNFSIEVKYKNNVLKLSEDDLEECCKEEFVVQDYQKIEHKFILYYIFLNNSIANNQFYYCANGRAVRTFDIGIQKKLKNNSSVNILLTGDYLDMICNNERNDFIISQNQNNPSIDAPLTFPEILKKLKEICHKIIIEKFPEIEEDNKKIIEEIEKEYPYLLKYYRNDNDIIKDKNEILKNLQSEFLKDKQEKRSNFKKMLEKNNVNIEKINENINEINEICCHELAEYIVYRNYILEAMEKLSNTDEKIEKFLHNLFMPLGSTSSQEDDMKLNIYDTNMWILDDKFMYYNKIYSDKKISVIKSDLMKYSKKIIGDTKEPDLSIFYKKNGDNSLDVVIIEFKGIGAKTDDKIVSITEINRNIGYIKENIEKEFKINSLYGYIITKINDEFDKELGYNNFKKVFSNGNKPNYHSYIETIQANIYVLDVDNIIKDSKSRNDLFLQILRNESNN